jgi:REP element-mobilizing transposase RayT
MRGDGGDAIYLSDIDRRIYLNTLEEACARNCWACYAYCLMNNHYHLLIETPLPNLATGMRHLNGVYTQRFNKRHDRRGHVFQGRYHAVLVDKDEYFLEVARYIVLNPVRAQLVSHPEQWIWSSYNATVGAGVPPWWLHSDNLLSVFSNSRPIATEQYRRFVAQGHEHTIWNKLTDRVFLGSETFAKDMLGKWSAIDSGEPS